MKKILLDTNAYTAFKLGNEKVLKVLQHADEIGVSSIVLGELLAGFSVGTKEKRNREDLNQFLNAPRVRLLSVDDDTALFYAGIYKQLRKDGKPIPTNDLWIAAICMQHGYLLCSYDKHFTYVQGLFTCKQLTDLLL